MATSPLLVNACIGTLLAAIVIQAVAFLADTWKKRSLMKRLSEQGKPMPPFNLLMGHLLSAKSAADALPPSAHSVYILNSLAAQHAPQGAYYVDFTPMAWPMLVVTDPYLATQVVEHPVVGSRKPDELYAWFHPITNGQSLFTQNGAAWKRDRDYFLPFFSNQNLDASVPFVVGQMAIFRDKLREKARGDGGMFVLEPLILSMMNDIIGKLVLNADLGTQHGSHPLATTMLRQLRLKFAVNNPLDNLGQLNPLKVFNLWNNSRMLDNHIKSQIDTRLQAWRLKKTQDEQNDFKSLLDVALEAYMNQDNTASSPRTDVSTAFSKTLCSQMRMFFFAGYDSTASTMAYCCYTAWQHPEALRKMRAEHDQVFGHRSQRPDDDDAALDAIRANPAVLNALPYTTAVIKETMRLFPAANGIRQGHRDLVLRDGQGNEFPTDGCSVQMLHYAIQRSPKVWARPSEFLPERFLVEPGHELYPAKGAWRPFEYGPRLCTGQQLVMKELKAFLVLLAREFDIKECYSEFDGDRKMDLTNVDFEKAHLVEAGAAHPRANFPCRVSFSEYQTSTSI
ncbi:thiamine diphosphate-binding protein [Apiospora rasikravindrae]|uniref:Thiamine diphosphate-binding protein n=1 Tax=Apiospora rasikravindrae TaxID=990691 RepID=A0ABR1TDG8_9PEZI